MRNHLLPVPCPLCHCCFDDPPTQAGHPSSPSLTLTPCPLSNVSICDVTLSAKAIVAVLYNPASHAVSTPVRVNVDGTSWAVVDGSGASVNSTILTNMMTRECWGCAVSLLGCCRAAVLLRLCVALVLR